MIFRKIAFGLVILFFAAIAVIMVADLLNAAKKIDKQNKKNSSKINVKTNAKKSRYNN